MKVGDLVKRKDQGISMADAKKYLGHIGIIVGSIVASGIEYQE